MSIETTIAEIDGEISRLQQVRSLLTQNGAKPATTRIARRKRKMSAAARKRIGDAQRKRWAKQKAAK